MDLHKDLTPAEMKELLEAFTLFDKNNDGVISADEFRSVLVALGYTDNLEDAMVILDNADINEDGVLSYQEYASLIKEHIMPKQTMIREIRDIFTSFDKNQKGFIDYQDFKRFLNSMGLRTTEEEMYHQFEQMDKDGNGKLSLDDISPTIYRIRFES